MSWYDNVVNYGKKAIDPGGLLFNQGVKPQPGVGGSASDATRLVQDPSTGMYFDPSTGTTYTDPMGRIPVTDPNVAQQVAANYNRQTQFLTNAGQVFGQQQALATHLNDVIAGRAPSVAEESLKQGLGTIGAEQLSQAAGVGGDSAPLARLMAMRNTGAASIGANQAGAIARAGETAAAENALGSLLSTEANQQLGAAGTYGQLAEGGQEKQQGLNTETEEQNAANRQKLLGAGTSALGSYLSVGRK